MRETGLPARRFASRGFARKFDDRRLSRAVPCAVPETQEPSGRLNQLAKSQSGPLLRCAYRLRSDSGVGLFASWSAEHLELLLMV